MSTNKVYGDGPNSIKLKELESRWEYDDPILQTEYQKLFPLINVNTLYLVLLRLRQMLWCKNTVDILEWQLVACRGGCLTGPSHSGVELHGFLSYLVKCNLEERTYNIFGYKGKQVRDNIHSEDVARFIECFLQAPKSAEVYNLGGGKANSCSILEAFEICEGFSGIKQKHEYFDDNRIGDHVCYYSDLSKIKYHYPEFEIRHSLDDTIKQIVEAYKCRSDSFDPSII